MSKYILLGIVIMVVVGVGGWFFFMRQSNQNVHVGTVDEHGASQTSGHAPVPPEANVTTQEWQTYTSETLHYTIQVPKNWKIHDTKGVFIGSPGEVAFLPHGDQDGLSVPKMYITVSTGTLPRYDLSTEAQYNQWLAAPVAEVQTHQYKYADTTVAGIKAVQYVIRTLSGDATEPTFQVVTWFRRDGKNYNIEFAYPSEEEFKIYNKMLTSFQFID